MCFGGRACLAHALLAIIYGNRSIWSHLLPFWSRFTDMNENTIYDDIPLDFYWLLQWIRLDNLLTFSGTATSALGHVTDVNLITSLDGSQYLPCRL